MSSFVGDEKNVKRSRPTLLFFLILVVTAGLVSRKFPMVFPELSGTTIGDALWALMVFLCWAFLFPSSSTPGIATLALLSSYCVEFSQLYQAQWINEIRHTVVGHLILGTTFWWPDLIAYMVGVIGGVILDKLVLFRSNNNSR